MKSKSKLIILPLLGILICGCTHSNGKKSSSNPTSESSQPTSHSSLSSSSSSSSTSVPTPEPMEKTKLAYTYDDYQAHTVYGLDNCPLVDSPKLLVIPVWFTDSDNFIDSSKKNNVREDILTTYVGTNTEAGWRSVKTYYEEESFNKMSLEAIVSDWYECGSSSSYYENDPEITKTTSLVNTAVTWYFTNHSSDSRTNYDTNGDGYLDGVMLIYAAADYRTQGIENENLWAYCYWVTSSSDKTNPNPNAFFWASYDFMYDSTTASLRAGTSYGAGNCDHCSVDAHTFIHEMGHVLGLDDYYDYNWETQYCPAGGFSMQDYNMGGHDPYSVIAYGWADPYIPTETTTIEINDFQSSHDVILLANKAGVVSPFDEYILIELYTPTGLNELDSIYQYSPSYKRGPDEVGIRVWHVDARLTYPTGYSVGSYKWSTKLITEPDYYKAHYGVYHAMSNSYGDKGTSVLGEKYYNYNILQFIRNNVNETYTPQQEMENKDLFKQGDTFSLSKYSKQFVQENAMNDGKDLGWSFKVDSISNNKAVITVTKAN